MLLSSKNKFKPYFIYIQIGLLLSITAILIFAFWPASTQYQFPNNKKFAFAILDDSDYATLQNIKPVYSYLKSKGVISTKTVWSLKTNKDEHGYTPGDSLENPAYKEFIQLLQNQRFEIASHGSRGASSNRKQIKQGLEEYKTTIGTTPIIHVNHRYNKENLYWGKYRLSFNILQWLYLQAKNKHHFYGQIKHTPYYWEDIAKNTIQLSRDFSFNEINLAKIGSIVPRYVQGKSNFIKWFYSSNGDDVKAFNKLLHPKNLNQLEKERGYTIVYTHFGKGFYKDGRIDATFKQRIEDLTKRDVWITTTGNLLHFLSNAQKQDTNTTITEFRLQLRWSLEQVGRIFSF